MNFDSIRKEVRAEVSPSIKEYPKTRAKYQYEFDKDGRKVLKKTGDYTNVYAMIQEGKDDNTPRSVLQRIQKGDMTAIGDLQAGFMDALVYPKNFMEAQNVRLQMENMFNSLTAEQKATYGQDVNRFVKDMNEKLDVKLKADAEKRRQDLVNQQNGIAAQTPVQTPVQTPDQNSTSGGNQ